MNIIGYNETIEQHHFTAAFESMEGFEVPRDAPPREPLERIPEAAGNNSKFNLETTSSGLNLTKEQHVREHNAVKTSLTIHGGNVSAAARDLEISRQLLHYKMKKHNLKREQFITNK